MKDEKKLQLFTVKINEEDMGKIISGLMEFPAGAVYNLLKDLESQTKLQRDLPEDKKEWQPVDIKK